MSYSVSGSGHGADVEAVKEAFADFVGALDAATAEDGTKFSGGLSGGQNDASGTWQQFGITADEARQRNEAAEASAEADDSEELPS